MKWLHSVVAKSKASSLLAGQLPPPTSQEMRNGVAPLEGPTVPESASEATLSTEAERKPHQQDLPVDLRASRVKRGPHNVGAFQLKVSVESRSFSDSGRDNQ